MSSSRLSKVFRADITRDKLHYVVDDIDIYFNAFLKYAIITRGAYLGSEKALDPNSWIGGQNPGWNSHYGIDFAGANLQVYSPFGRKIYNQNKQYVQESCRVLCTRKMVNATFGDMRSSKNVYAYSIYVFPEKTNLCFVFIHVEPNRNILNKMVRIGDIEAFEYQIHSAVNNEELYLGKTVYYGSDIVRIGSVVTWTGPHVHFAIYSYDGNINSVIKALKAGKSREYVLTRRKAEALNNIFGLETPSYIDSSIVNQRYTVIFENGKYKMITGDNGSVTNNIESKPIVFKDNINIVSLNTVNFLDFNVSNYYGANTELLSLSPEVDSPSACIIGDTNIVVQPTDIHFMIRDINIPFNTIRYNAVPLLKSGNSESIIEISAVFPDIPSINYKLRHILAQYLRTPFTILENKHINKIVFGNILPAIELPKYVTNISAEGSKVLQYAIASGIYDINELISKSKDILGEKEWEKKDDKVERERIEKYLSMAEQYKNIEYRSGISFEDQVLAVVLDSVVLSSIEGHPGSIQATFGLKIFNYIPYVNTFAFCKSYSDSYNQMLNKMYIYMGKPEEQKPVDFTFAAGASEPYVSYYTDILEEHANTTYDNCSGETILRKVRENTFDKYVFSYNYTNSDYLDIKLNKLYTDLKTFKSMIDSVEEYMKQAGISLGDFILTINGYIKSIWTEFFGALKALLRAPAYAYNKFVDTLKNNINMSQEDNSIKTSISVYLENLLKRMRETVPSAGEVASVQEQEIGKIINDIVNIGEDNNKKMRIALLLGNAVRDAVDQIVKSSFAELFIMNQESRVVIENTSKTAITSWSASYRNRFVPLKTLQFNMPTYQFIGRDNWEVTLNIKTTDIMLIQELRVMQNRIQYTAAVKNRFSILTKTPILPITIKTNDSGVFGLLGVRECVIDFIDIQSIKGNPGAFNVVIKFVQNDLSMYGYERITDLRMVKPSDVINFYNLLYNIYKSGKADQYKDRFFVNYLLSKFKDLDDKYTETQRKMNLGAKEKYRRLSGKATDITKVKPPYLEY